jgi:hypothetical protein
MVALSGTISEKTYQRLKRIQDLVSQSKQKVATLDDALDVVFEEYLERHDPVIKAERIVAKNKQTATASANYGASIELSTNCEPSVSVASGITDDANFQAETSTSKNKTSKSKPNWSRDQVNEQVGFKRERLPSHLIHQLELRDQGQCTKHTNGVRCTQRRWLHYHHIVPKHRGGADTLENLTTLCSAHHKMEHLAKLRP